MKTNVIVNLTLKFPSWIQCAASRMGKSLQIYIENQLIEISICSLIAAIQTQPQEPSQNPKIVRICSEPEIRDKRIEETKQLLLNHGHQETSLETRQAMAWKSIQCNLFFLKKL